MIAVDTQILVYAHLRRSEFHDRAAAKVRELAEGRRAWAIPWACLYEFLAIATHPRIYRFPSSLTQASAQVDAWLESPSLTVLGEASDHWPTLRTLMASGKVTGVAVHDARVAALCKSHGVTELWSADRDFNRFPSLPVNNPLID